MEAKGKTIKVLVIDDHDAVVNGTVDAIYSQYSEADIIKAKTSTRSVRKNSRSFQRLAT